MESQRASSAERGPFAPPTDLENEGTEAVPPGPWFEPLDPGNEDLRQTGKAVRIRDFPNTGHRFGGVACRVRVSGRLDLGVQEAVGSVSSSWGSTACFRRCGARGRCVLVFEASDCGLPGLSDSGVTGGSSRPSPVTPSPRRTRVRLPTLEKAAAIPVPPSVSRPPNPSTVRPSFRTSAVAPLTFPSGPRRARVLRTMPPPTLRAACPTRTATRAAFSPSTAIR